MLIMIIGYKAPVSDMFGLEFIYKRLTPLGMMETQWLRAPLKPLGMIWVWCLRGFSRALHWASMMTRGSQLLVPLSALSLQNFHRENSRLHPWPNRHRISFNYGYPAECLISISVFLIFMNIISSNLLLFARIKNF